MCFSPDDRVQSQKMTVAMETLSFRSGIFCASQKILSRKKSKQE